MFSSNLWHLKSEICTSHPDSRGESGYRQVLFPAVRRKKKTTSPPSDLKKCCHFLHFIFKGREIPFNTCHSRKATILLFVIRTAAFFSPRLFAGDNLSLSRAFDVSVERNITSDFFNSFFSSQIISSHYRCLSDICKKKKKRIEMKAALNRILYTIYIFVVVFTLNFRDAPSVRQRGLGERTSFSGG